MTGAIEQRAARLLPPAESSADPRPSSAVRHGHHAMVAGLIRDCELAVERITDLDEIPLDLLARFARALNTAERNALARVRHLEEETT